MKIKNFITIMSIIVTLALITGKAMSQPNTLSYMKGIPYTKDINPAMFNLKSGFYLSLGLPKFDIAARTSGFKYNDLIHRANGSPSAPLVIDMGSFYDKLRNTNYISSDISYTSLEFGFRTKKNFVSFSFSIKGEANMRFEKNLIEYIKDGNSRFFEQSFKTTGLGPNGLVYAEAALNYGREINEKLAIGVALKGLAGAGTVNSRGLEYNFVSNKDIFGVYVGGSAYISAPIEPIDTDREYSTDELHIYAGSFAPFDNKGFALDLGATYQLTDRLRLSASVIDLGMISWKNGYKLTPNAKVEYSAMDISKYLKDEALNDDKKSPIKEDVKFKFRKESFSTMLTAKTYIGADYQLTNAVTVGGLGKMYLINEFSYSFTTSANIKLGRILDFALSHSIVNGKANIAGAGLGLRLGPLQIYTISDNLLAALNPAKTNYVNARIGITWIFGDNRWKKRQKRLAAPPALMDVKTATGVTMDKSPTLNSKKVESGVTMYNGSL